MTTTSTTPAAAAATSGQDQSGRGTFFWRLSRVTWPYFRARSLYRLGRLDGAFAITNDLKALKYPTLGVDLLRARIRLKQNRVSEAFEFAKEELRLFPDNKAASDFLAGLNYQHGIDEASGKDPEYAALLKVVRPYTMLSAERLYSLYTLARRVCEEDVPGNFVECGVAGGGSSALLAAVIAKYSKRPRKHFACDTFEGLPAPKDIDAHAGVTAEQAGWGEGTCAAPVTSLQKVSRELKVEEIIVPLKGFFADTLPVSKTEIGGIALLHLDGDWYDSTRDILVNLYEQVVPSGVMQIDDYGFWEGCSRAVHDYEKEHRLTFTLHKIDFSGVWMAKEQPQQQAEAATPV